MSYQVLARKWRPGQFAEVVGQSHVVSALSNALDQGRVHHAFLFTGTRGVGKTTLARIFAKALNCEKGVSSTPCGECASCIAVAEGRFIDLIEVDAASRTKVDDTREMLENVQYAPTQGRYKVYLIDEVHMLSAHSFNALLKTLEEPPEHVKFLLATTDPQKLPMTVLSRCIQFSLNAIEPQAIEKQLSTILESEAIDFERGALSLLARAADGSLRDALSLLDQAIAYCDRQLSENSVRKMLGLVDGQTVIEILDALAQKDADALMRSSTQLIHAAQDLKTALDDLLSYLHALALYQFAPDAIEWKSLAAAEVKRLADLFLPEELQLYYQIVLNGKRDFALAPDPRTGFEMVLLRLMAFKPGEAAVSTRNKPGDTSIKSDGVSTPTHKVAETDEPFLEYGLQNSELKRHLKPASAIARPEQKSEKTPVSTPAETGSKIQTDSETETRPEVQSDPEIRPEAGAEPLPESAREEVRETQINPSYLPKEMMQINTLIDNINVWSDFVMKIGLTGMARQLAAHMTPLSYKDGVLHLQLDRQYSNLQSADRLQQISNALQQGSGQTFKVNIEFGEVMRDQTAAGVIAERERSNLDKTRQDFREDDNVREIMSLFDAEVDESSIKPVN